MRYLTKIVFSLEIIFNFIDNYFIIFNKIGDDGDGKIIL